MVVTRRRAGIDLVYLDTLRTAQMSTTDESPSITTP